MRTAIITISSCGLRVARKLQEGLKGALYAPEEIVTGDLPGIIPYD